MDNSSDSLFLSTRLSKMLLSFLHLSLSLFKHSKKKQPSVQRRQGIPQMTLAGLSISTGVMYRGRTPIAAIYFIKNCSQHGNTCHSHTHNQISKILEARCSCFSAHLKFHLHRILKCWKHVYSWKIANAPPGLLQCSHKWHQAKTSEKQALLSGSMYAKWTQKQIRKQR